MTRTYSGDGSSVPDASSGGIGPPNGNPPAPRFNLEMCTMCSNSLVDEKVLPCSHSICGNCLKSHRWSSVLVCSVCRYEHDIDCSTNPREHSPLQRIVLGLIETSSTDRIEAEREIWGNCSGTSSSASPTNSTPTLSSSPISNANGQHNDSSTCRPFEESGAIPKVRTSTVNHGSQPVSLVNDVSALSLLPTNFAELVPRPPISSNSQFNDSLFPKDNFLSSVKIPPLSPVVGGETRTPKTAASALRNCPTSPSLQALPSRPIRERPPMDLPTCIHGRCVEEYYCAICIVVFCGLCIQDHKNHRFTPFHESNNLLKIILHDMLKETQSRETDVETSFLRTQSALENMEMNKILAEKDIEFTMRKVFENIEQTKNQMLHNLNLVHSMKGEMLFKQIQTLKNAKTHLMIIAKGIISKLDSTDTEELVAIHFLMNDSLKKMEQVTWYLQPHEDSTLSYQASLIGVFEEIANLGSIHSMAYAPKTRAYGVNTEVALINCPSYFTIKCFDHLGVKRTTGGDDVKVRLIYPNGKSVALAVKDYDNGDYTTMFISHERGEHSLIITLRGYPISNSFLKPIVQFRRPYKDINYPPIDTFGKGPNNQTSLSRGWGVHCDRDGIIYITERDIHCVLVFGPSLNFIRKFGHYGDRDGELNRPAGITVDIFRRIIVVDKDNHRIQLFTLDGDFIKRFGRRGQGNGEFQYPWDVDTNSKGNIIVSDSRNHRVQLFDKDGTFLLCSEDTLGRSNYKLIEIPRGVCFDAQGNIYVVDFNNHHVLILSPKMQLMSTIGKYGDSEGMFFRPQGIFVDPKGYIFIVESKNNRAQIFTPNKKFFHMITCSNEKETFAPCDITMSPDGYLYMVDIELGCVYKM